LDTFSLILSGNVRKASPIRLLPQAMPALLLLFCVADMSFADSCPFLVTRGHSHNDYAHERPLLDALALGFCSVEADINLVEGQLLVAHSLEQTSPERTLQRLYLDPLRERVRANGGSVHPGEQPFWLLIDMKTEGAATYAVLHAVLEQYADMLTTYRGSEVMPGAVTVVVDGGRRLIMKQEVRYAAIDGSLSDLDLDTPASLIPWISAEWRSAFKWNGQGPMPEDERAKIRTIVRKAHEKGRKVRFYGLPLWPDVWPELYDAGVDLLNADDLAGLRKFLLSREKKK